MATPGGQIAISDVGNEFNSTYSMTVSKAYSLTYNYKFYYYNYADMNGMRGRQGPFWYSTALNYWDGANPSCVNRHSDPSANTAIGDTGPYWYSRYYWYRDASHNEGGGRYEWYDGGRWYCNGTWNIIYTSAYVSSGYYQAYDSTIMFWVRTYGYDEYVNTYYSRYEGTGGQRYLSWPQNQSSYGISSAGVSMGYNTMSVIEHGPNYMPALARYDFYRYDQWTHVCIVYSGGVPYIYFNGSYVAGGYRGYQGFPAIGIEQMCGGAYGYWDGHIAMATHYSGAWPGWAVNQIFQWQRGRFGI